MMAETGKAKIVIPDRIKQGDAIRVQTIVQHPMDTGFFRDANADLIPPWFINDVRVLYGDEEIARFEWTSGISKDPVVTFLLRADREAPLTFVWRDNKSREYRSAIDIKFAT
ncbi:MAG TPA: thiosulfate oxidation carrier complex protein SoxZ [Gemmatimonadales bacterium]|nr:thiosulfate oxidation carrier complex protein SoxZ [Gemmatimonadales bacterium]